MRCGQGEVSWQEFLYFLQEVLGLQIAKREVRARWHAGGACGEELEEKNWLMDTGLADVPRLTPTPPFSGPTRARVCVVRVCVVRVCVVRVRVGVCVWHVGVGVGVCVAQLKNLWRMLDENASGSIDFTEFADALFPSMDSEAADPTVKNGGPNGDASPAHPRPSPPDAGAGVRAEATNAPPLSLWDVAVPRGTGNMSPQGEKRESARTRRLSEANLDAALAASQASQAAMRSSQACEAAAAPVDPLARRASDPLNASANLMAAKPLATKPLAANPLAANPLAAKLASVTKTSAGAATASSASAEAGALKTLESSVSAMRLEMRGCDSRVSELKTQMDEMQRLLLAVLERHALDA